MTTEIDENIDLRSFTAVINTRLATEARLAKAIGFGWLCGGGAIAFLLAGLGVALALWGYSYLMSVQEAGNQVAEALVDALQRSEIKTTISGTMSLAPGSELRLATGQSVRLEDGATVKLDPNSSVRVVGDLKMPQPSQHQLQADAPTGNNELPFTSYTVFRTVNFGPGTVIETAWLYDLSDTTRPRYQSCHYRQAFDEGLAGKIRIAVNGSPQRPSPLIRLPFKFEEALANCSWFSGY
jgi:hypothetical protein